MLSRLVNSISFLRWEVVTEHEPRIFFNDGKVILFAFLPQSKLGHRAARVKLRGLDGDKIYKFQINEEEIEKSGSYLMNQGIDIKLIGDYDSKIIKFICK